MFIKGRQIHQLCTVLLYNADAQVVILEFNKASGNSAMRVSAGCANKVVDSLHYTLLTTSYMGDSFTCF